MSSSPLVEGIPATKGLFCQIGSQTGWSGWRCAARVKPGIEPQGFNARPKML